MNTLKKSFRLLSALIVFSVAAFMISCGDDSDALASTDKQSASSESSTDSYFEDADDISASVTYASNSDLEGGRTAGLIDERLVGATITLSEGADDKSGTITVDFGEGVTVNGVERKGKIIIVYDGPRLTEGSSHTITFDNFYVNDVKIEGTRAVVVSEVETLYITHEITLTDGKIIWTDGSSVTRDSYHFRKWTHNNDSDRSNDAVSILEGGTASGTNSKGLVYAMQITADIEIKASCAMEKKFLPSSGEKVLLIGSSGGREITINYGSGDCDNSLTVTINGKTTTVTVSRS